MSKKILVIIEVRDGKIKKASLEALSEARRQGGEISACLIGDAVAGLAPALAGYGAATVYTAEDARLTSESSQELKGREETSPRMLDLEGGILRLPEGQTLDASDINVEYGAENRAGKRAAKRLEE